MESSDDERDDLPEFVTNYHFEDGSDEPVSFAVLPITWTTSDIKSSGKQISLRGSNPDGLAPIYKLVSTWRFDLSGKKPQISVFTKDKNWIKLMKPRPSFANSIRTVLITVNFLYLVKKNPEMTGKVIWDSLSRKLSLFDEKPTTNDLDCHKALIEEAVKRDEALAKSKSKMNLEQYLMARFENQEERNKEDVPMKEKRGFIVNDDASDQEEDGGSDKEDDDSSEEEEEPYDSVCCICDNGGSLLCCDGICMRSFHATRKAAEEAFEDPEAICKSLRLSEEQVKAMHTFKCLNCKYMQHQCFSCGKLGSSDKSGSPEVFQCVNATCGYFYHPRCVAKLLHRDNDATAQEVEDKILAGELFTCPLHTCSVCKQSEDKNSPGLQMAVCRRCPKAYHEKCLPRKIAFDDNEEDLEARAWKELLVDRILIYCLKHEILDDLKTPERNHIKFPELKKKEQRNSSSVLREGGVVQKKKKPLVAPASLMGTASQPKKKILQASTPCNTEGAKGSNLKGSHTLKKPISTKKNHFEKVARSSEVAECEDSLGDQLYEYYNQRPGSVKVFKSKKTGEEQLSRVSKPTAKDLDQQLDSKSERRILNLMKEAKSSISLDKIIQQHENVISSNEYKHKMENTKNITQGKVQGVCQAIREALKKLNAGCTKDEVKTICDERSLKNLDKWRDRYKVYLGPFIHGKRYTSYGRHFTHPSKLVGIVDKIHHYVNGGDMIVDFCCGSNDFSCLMKRKLEMTGKKCSYKNFDLFPQKNDFAFVQKDWMKVEEKDFPPGKDLIMGLNPPFGVKGAQANSFINKALKFRPKLLILIVPPETERLDKKRTPYDLIWEDTGYLAGKAFYLPGSINVNDQQMDDWNKIPPVLYLWSRPDWTSRHRAIAAKHGHLNGERGDRNERVHDTPVNIQDEENTFAVTVVNDGPPQNNLPQHQKQRSTSREKLDDCNHQFSAFDGEVEKWAINSVESTQGSRDSRKRRDQMPACGRSVDNFVEQKRHRSSNWNPHDTGSRYFASDTVSRRPYLETESSGHQRSRSPSDMDIASPTVDSRLDQHTSSTSGYDHGRDDNLGRPNYNRHMNYNPDASVHPMHRGRRSIDATPPPETDVISGYDQVRDDNLGHPNYNRHMDYNREASVHPMHRGRRSIDATPPPEADVYGSEGVGRRLSIDAPPRYAADEYRYHQERGRTDATFQPAAEDYGNEVGRWPSGATPHHHYDSPTSGGYMREDGGYPQFQPNYNRNSGYPASNSRSGMNHMPITQRYAFSLNGSNPGRVADLEPRLMGRGAGGGGYLERQPISRVHPTNTLGFGRDPINRYPPHTDDLGFSHDPINRSTDHDAFGGWIP